MSRNIERINRTEMYDGSVVTVYQDEMLLPSGETQKWDFVHRKKGAAAVVPVLPDGRIIMIKQFRSPLNRITLEVPAGAMEDGEEDSSICALRELEEETGYYSKDISFLMHLKPISAYCDENIDLYYVNGIEKVTNQNLDPGEKIDTVIMDLDDLLDMIFRGELQDGKTVAALLAYAVKIERSM